MSIVEDDNELGMRDFSMALVLAVVLGAILSGVTCWFVN